MIHTQVVKTGQSQTKHTTMWHKRLPRPSALGFLLVITISGVLSLIKQGSSMLLMKLTSEQQNSGRQKEVVVNRLNAESK